MESSKKEMNNWQKQGNNVCSMATRLRGFYEWEKMLLCSEWEQEYLTNLIIDIIITTKTEHGLKESYAGIN